MFGKKCLEYLVKNYNFNTVLDIGSGKGEHSKFFLEHNKHVYSVDIGSSAYFLSQKNNYHNIEFIKGDFNTLEFYDQTFDCTWACHVLEHQRNIGLFLDKVISITKDNGIICITVPPMKPTIVGGHLSIWNAGLLLYNLVLCGLDCHEAKILEYGYNISIIVEKRKIELPHNLSYDVGDIEKLKQFFPNGHNYQGFDGNIRHLNWN
jgi:SAM-dependent methyltransferase